LMFMKYRHLAVDKKFDFGTGGGGSVIVAILPPADHERW
jgi:hypothetical protein